jgi:hypothetical protein
MRMKKIYIGVISLFLIIPAATFAQTDGLLNYWTLDEGMGRSANDSVGGQNGVMTGESQGFGWASGKVATAVGLDGMPGESIALPDAVLKGSQGSISQWVKLTSLSDGNVLFSGRSTTDNSVYIALIVDHEGRPSLISRDSANGNDQVVQSSKILSVNEWYHLVFTADARTYRVFVNGEEFSIAGNNNGRWFSDLTNQTLSYRIGALTSNPRTGVLNGMIDDVRIYDHALTVAEVQKLYDFTNAAVPTVPAGIAPSIDMTISADTVPSGGSVAIRWTTKNVLSCSKEGAWSGTASTTGEEVIVKIGSSADYTLNCSGKTNVGGTSKTVHVNVGVNTITSTSTVTTVGTSTTSLIVSALPIAPVYTRNLTVGSRGDDVRNLQSLLIGKGLLSSTVTGYFGGLTKAALANFQRSKGLPATGFFGPMTRAVLAQE